jgi:hypothetical protein
MVIFSGRTPLSTYRAAVTSEVRMFVIEQR